MEYVTLGNFFGVVVLAGFGYFIYTKIRDKKSGGGGSGSGSGGGGRGGDTERR